MIPGITEIGFGPGTNKDYATLHQATVSLTDMGDRTISTQVRIDGDVAPDFSGWELQFKGERFILPIRDPQASKDNSSRNSIIDLTFTSWVVDQLKRYFFVSLATISAGVEVPDKYVASVSLNARGFVDLFKRVLKYYFGDTIQMELDPNAEIAEEPSAVDIDHTLIWDVLTKFYEIYNLRWTIETRQSAYVIRVGFPADELNDHDFAYGFDGGLLKFERQVQDDDIRNILLGRGGEKNLPYRYFKKTDPQNPDWAADPDAIPELANVYFDRLRDINFRWYIRGWVKNSNRDTSGDAGYTLPDYDYDDVPDDYLWAYTKGRDTDTKFNPVEYVKDDDSIAKFGERWGALDDNDEVYPTIQGVQGDPDITIAVSDILTDDIEAAAKAAVTEVNIDVPTVTHDFPIGTSYDEYVTSKTLYVPIGKTANINIIPLHPYRWEKNTSSRSSNSSGMVKVDVPASEVTYEISAELVVLQSLGDSNNNATTSSGTDSVAIAGITPGYYYLRVRYRASRVTSTGRAPLGVTYGVNTATMVMSDVDENAWKPTFDIWVKNIWGSTQAQGESDTAYAARIWGPILGDRLGNEAKLVFSTGFMSISEDYEFTIASYPTVDRTKTFNGSQSEWKITLYKSDAEYDATGLYIPNSKSPQPQAGDRFFFIGIDMPHQYVEWAEERLNATKTESLDNTSDINPTWVIGLDKIRVHTFADNEYGQVLADRIKAGTLIRITDPRFTGGNILNLYAQSITYTWNEPSEDSPYIVPDIEVVLSDKVVSKESPIGKLSNDVSTIQSTFVRATDLDSAIRRITNPLYLKKTGETEVSASPTSFASKINSTNFRMGEFGGAGWGYYEDGNGQSILELDKLIVRNEMKVNSLVANQIAYIGGKQIISAAAIECTQVTETETGYICYFDQKQGSVANLFKVGDIAMGQSFSAENDEERYYRAAVTAITENSITLSKTTKSGDGVPQQGDTIIQYGNTSDSARQFIIIRDVIGGGYEQMLSGLNSVSAIGNEYYFAGAKDNPTIEEDTLLDSEGNFILDSEGYNITAPGAVTHNLSPRWFVGNHSGEYAEWQNGELTVKGNIIVKRGSGVYSDIGYLANALPESSTIISGGVVLSKIIGVMDENDNLTAGINALDAYDDTTHGRLMIFAGAQGNAASDIKTSPFRVYADGYVEATAVNLKEGCFMGEFSIAYDTNWQCSIFSGTYRRSQYWNSYTDTVFSPGRLKNSMYNSSGTEIGHVLIGDHPSNIDTGTTRFIEIATVRSMSETSGSSRKNQGIYCDIRGSGMTGEGIYVISTTTGASNTGINITVSGATANVGILINSTGEAIIAQNGTYAGLRPRIRTISSSATYTNLDNIIICANTSAITQNLPDSPLKGQMYIIFHTTANALTINGNGKNILSAYGSGGTATTTVLNVRQTVWLFYDGTRWITNYLSH